MAKLPPPDPALLKQLDEEDSKSLPPPDPKVLKDMDDDEKMPEWQKSAAAGGIGFLKSLPVAGTYLPQMMGAAAWLHGDDYTSTRDAAIQRQKEIQEGHPVANAVGSVAAIPTAMAAQSFLPGPEAATSLSEALPQAAKAMGVMVGSKALENPGDVKGKVNMTQLGDRAQNVGDSLKDPLNAALTVAPLAMAGAGQAVNAMSKIAPAEKAAYLATGPNAKKFMENIRKGGDTTKAEQIGRYALDSGLISPTSTYESIYWKSKDKLNDVGNQIGSLYSSAKDKIESYLANAPQNAQAFLQKGFNLAPSPNGNTADKIMGDANDLLRSSPDKQAALDKLQGWLDQIHSETNGQNPDLLELHKMKQQLGQSIDFGKTSQQSPDIQKAYSVALKYVNDGIDNEMNYFQKIVGGDQAKQLKDLNSEYSMLSDINSSSGKRYGSHETKGLGLASSLGATSAGGITYGLTRDPAKAAEAAIIGATVAPTIQKGVETVANRAQSAKASLIDSVVNKPMTAIKPYLAYQQIKQGFQNPQEQLEGYPKNLTQQVDPDQLQLFQTDIKSNPGLSNVDKANRLNLLNKHMRIYTGN